MRIEIDDWNAYRHQIDTADPALAGQWLVEKCLLLMSANMSYGECRLRIWPSSQAEAKTIGQHDTFLNQAALLKLAESILTVSAQLGEAESAADR